MNEDNPLRLNSFSLLVEVPPSLKAPRLTPSPHLTQLHREASKQQQQQNTLESGCSGVGGFRMDQRRRVRLESVVVWEQKVQVILVYFR